MRKVALLVNKSSRNAKNRYKELVPPSEFESLLPA